MADATETRVIAFTRAANETRWTVERGLADGEVVGEGQLHRVESLQPKDLRMLDSSIEGATGQGVTVIDLIEGDVALCIWEGNAVREVYFADPLLAVGARADAAAKSNPAQATGSATGGVNDSPAARASNGKSLLASLAMARDARAEAIARGALVAAQSRTPSIASFGRSRASAASVVLREGAAVARLETCQAVLDYAQDGVAPKSDAQFLLYFGLARAIEGSAPASPR
jgi:hypothetical protein